MEYLNIAKEILKEKVKSAVFIDENAREFNSNEESSGASEEQLSIDLYSNFRSAGVCLEPIKYNPKDEDNEDWMSYTLGKRDLILLDWHLEGINGELQSLKILNKIIQSPNIHFCIIYTSYENLDLVFKRILTNFSFLTIEQYNRNKELTEALFGDNFKYDEFHELIGLSKNETKEKIGNIFDKYKTDILNYKNETKISDTQKAIQNISLVNLDEFHRELEHPLPCPNYINKDKYLIEINNTIISIFNKKENDPSKLLDNFYKHITNSTDSFNQLLAIDFFNRISKTGIINKDNNINFSKDALFEYRLKLKKEGSESLFEDFINEILYEKLKLSLRNSKSNLLSEEVFNEINNIDNQTSNEDKHKMNVFYNSSILNKKDQYINFGDVFKIKNEEKYLICITPLCDCLRPQEKIKRNYFFASGENIDLDKALEYSETAFISFLPNGKAVRWTEIPNDSTKYNPVYIKPLQYKVLENSDKINSNNEIELFYLNKEGEKKSKIAQYITTIRQNYAQRISNHTFSYPMRVGVDFAKF